MALANNQRKKIGTSGKVESEVKESKRAKAARTVELHFTERGYNTMKGLAELYGTSLERFIASNLLANVIDVVHCIDQDLQGKQFFPDYPDMIYE